AIEAAASAATSLPQALHRCHAFHRLARIRTRHQIRPGCVSRPSMITLALRAREAASNQTPFSPTRFPHPSLIYPISLAQVFDLSSPGCYEFGKDRQRLSKASVRRLARRTGGYQVDRQAPAE